jgi:ankyrin repeat protein
MNSIAIPGELSRTKCELHQASVADVLDFDYLMEDDGATPLHMSVNSVSMTRILLESGEDPNAFDMYFSTPLHDACEAGEYDVVEMLIEHGANVLSRRYAIDLIGQEVVQLMNQRDEFVQLMNQTIKREIRMYGDRKSCLHLTTDRRIVHLLLDHGADQDATDIYGNKPLL